MRRRRAPPSHQLLSLVGATLKGHAARRGAAVNRTANRQRHDRPTADRKLQRVMRFPSIELPRRWVEREMRPPYHPVDAAVSQLDAACMDFCLERAPAAFA